MHLIYKENTSKLARAVGDCLTQSAIFSGYHIHIEYPVSSVSPEYREVHWFDFAIPELKIVIECHGKQHYDVVDFSGKAEDAGISAYRDGKRRDAAKKQAAIDAGWTYIEIPYTLEKKITDDLIWNLYEKNKNGLVPDKKETIREKFLKSDAHKAQLEKARQHRKDVYNRSKALRSRRDKE